MFLQQYEVRMKAVCVLEAMLRKKDDDHFSVVFSYFTENSDAVVKCSESPQSSLREKAVRVIGLLGVGHSNSSGINSEKAVKTESTTAVELPDLIDTGDSNDNLEMENSTKNVLDQNIENLTSCRPPLVDDLFGDFSGSVEATNEPKNDDDPFAGVSFHTSEKKEHAADLFSGMDVGGDKPVDHGGRGQTSRSDPQPFDLFASNPEQTNHKEFVGDLMGGLSLEENTSSSNHKPSPPATTMQSESLFSGLNSQVPDNNLGGMLGSQTAGFNVNPMFPTGQLPYGVQPGMMLNHPYASQPFNYGAMGTLLAQQQLFATMANFQHLNNANMQNASAAQMTGPNGSTPLPDIFQPNFSNQPPTSLMNNSKKEDTKAFDFISDHIASARDSRRILCWIGVAFSYGSISGHILHVLVSKNTIKQEKTFWTRKKFKIVTRIEHTRMLCSVILFFSCLFGVVSVEYQFIPDPKNKQLLEGAFYSDYGGYTDLKIL
ncbi:hypothetical protein Ahy_A09g046465 isoform A [Arachis hypogaea]|uniref:VHS domain-containing protein n=1 Tax=Arachis hypogaea TaxID=3818 RepID=A0A445BPX4_ARAHY|nr:hypothetical protein Ahy_A09g046465 isoform A [Arachis hypogaea]